MPPLNQLPDIGPAPYAPPAPGPALPRPAPSSGTSGLGTLLRYAVAVPIMAGSVLATAWLGSLAWTWLREDAGPDTPAPAPIDPGSVRAKAADLSRDYLSTWAVRLREAATKVRAGSEAAKLAVELAEGWKQDRTARYRERVEPLEPRFADPSGPTPAEREAYAKFLEEIAQGADDAAQPPKVRDREGRR